MREREREKIGTGGRFIPVGSGGVVRPRRWRWVFLSGGGSGTKNIRTPVLGIRGEIWYSGWAHLVIFFLI
jgi:hypothetical protein